jgi:hypothetical protein
MRPRLAAALAVVVAGALSAAGAQATTAGPALRAVTVRPLVISGAHFAPREHVKVVVGRSIVARTVADAGGRFRAALPGVLMPRCGGVMQVKATGGAGTLAAIAIRIPLMACQIVRAPESPTASLGAGAITPARSP